MSPGSAVFKRPGLNHYATLPLFNRNSLNCAFTVMFYYLWEMQLKVGHRSSSEGVCDTVRKKETFTYEDTAGYNVIRMVHPRRHPWVLALKPQGGNQRMKMSLWSDTQSDFWLGLNLYCGEPGGCGEQRRSQARSWGQMRLKKRE